MQSPPVEISKPALNCTPCRWRHPVFGSAPRLTEDATSGIGFPPDTERVKRTSRPAPPPGAGRFIFCRPSASPFIFGFPPRFRRHRRRALARAASREQTISGGLDANEAWGCSARDVGQVGTNQRVAPDQCSMADVCGRPAGTVAATAEESSVAISANA